MGGLLFSLQEVGDIEIRALIHDCYLNRNKTGKVGIHFRIENKSLLHLSIYCLPKIVLAHPVKFMNGTNVNWFDSKQKSKQKAVDEWLLSVFNSSAEVFKKEALFAVNTFDEYVAYIEQYLEEVQKEDVLQEDYDALIVSITEYKQSTTLKSKHRAKINIVLFFTVITAKIY